MENTKNLIEQVIEQVIRRAADGVITERYGSAVQSEVKDAIKQEASRLVREDAEIKEMIRNNLIHWIKQQ